MDGVTLCELLRQAGYEPMSYSGRMMYGRHCVAFSAPTIKGPVAKIVLGAVRAGWDDETTTMLINDAAVDDLGLGKVIYWPDIAWPAGYEFRQERDSARDAL